MEETARDIILELYKKDYITKGETDVLLDAITVSAPVQVPYVDWAYRPYHQPSWVYKPYEQPSWTITSNTDTNNVE